MVWIFGDEIFQMDQIFILDFQPPNCEKFISKVSNMFSVLYIAIVLFYPEKFKYIILNYIVDLSKNNIICERAE